MPHYALNRSGNLNRTSVRFKLPLRILPNLKMLESSHCGLQSHGSQLYRLTSQGFESLFLNRQIRACEISYESRKNEWY